ncbi:unknown [Coprococcus eutactus CAG:665]|nr:unknown [Coprococcus eutactus CAG:665]
MNRKLKVMILIGSALVIGFSLWSMAHIGVTAHAAEYQPGLIGAVQVATPGDAEYLHKVRSLTDCYNALMLIAIEFMFWIMWNIVRTVYRILCDFKKF